MRYLRSLLLAVAAVLLCTSVSQATIMFGSDGFTSDLVRMDTSDGSSVVVANMPGLSNGLGMAYNPVSGLMYTRDFNNLFTVDVVTGATTSIGPSGSGITSLAFDSTFSTLYSFSQSNGNFYTVDPLTGTATLVGNTGLSGQVDMSTDSTGVLYAATFGGDIYTIDPLTATATLLHDDVDTRGFTAISFDENDQLFGVTLSGDAFVSIDLTLGTTTDIGGPNVRQDIRGLDFIRQLQPVPEPASVALWSLLGMAGLGYSRLRRRK